MISIPNPKKNITVNFPLEKVKSNIPFIQNLSNDKYKLTDSNEVINIFTFEALEFLSLGVFIDFNLSSIDDNKTTIEIEVRRKVGAFDKTHEITNANKHISNIIEILSKVLILTDEDILKQKKVTPLKNQKGCTNTAALMLIIITIICLIGVSCSKEESSSNQNNCGTYTLSNGTVQTVQKGSQGGCYYINSNNNKSYVDDKYCNCN
jgi:hypothetical protein